MIVRCARVMGMLVLAGTGGGFVCGAGGGTAVDEQVAAGEQVWQQRCVSCHLADGGNGPLLETDLLRSYGSALPLFDYTRMSMPWDAPGTLSDSAYWAVTAYLIDSRGFPLARPLSEANADSVSLLE